MVLLIVLLMAGFKAFPQTPTNGKLSIPTLVCADQTASQSLAIYEAQTIRELHFNSEFYPARPTLQIEQLKRVVAQLEPASPSRAQSYDRIGGEVFPLIKNVSTHLAADSSFNEIVIPLNCRLETLAVVEFDSYFKTKQVYLSTPLWTQLDGLGQHSFWLELLSLQELMQNNVGAVSSTIGSRVFSGYALAFDLVLQNRATRFQIFERIGFKYAEFETLGLCIQLSEPIKWSGDIPKSGFAYGELFFPECRLVYQGQKIRADGFYRLYDETHFEQLAIVLGLFVEPPGFRDHFLSGLYQTDLFFSGSTMDDVIVAFYPNGQVSTGVLSAKNHPHLKSDFFDLDIGRQKFGAYDNWSDSFIEFWPNGIPKKIETAHGYVIIQGKPYDLTSGEISFHPSGQIQCSSFLPGVTFKNKNQTTFRVKDNKRRVCFDQNSYPIQD